MNDAVMEHFAKELRMRLEEEIQLIRILRIEPGQQLVVTYPGVCPEPLLNVMKDFFSKNFPGVPVLILTEGVKLGVEDCRSR